MVSVFYETESAVKQNKRRGSGAQDGVGRVLQRPALLICELVPLSEAIGSRKQDILSQPILCNSHLHCLRIVK